MTYEDVVTMLEEADLPLAYDHFAEGEAPDPPFLVFLCPDTDTMFADDRVYEKIETLAVELYTDRKDPAAEAKVEAILGRHGLPWQKTEVWIESEKMYEARYETQITGG